MQGQTNKLTGHIERPIESVNSDVDFTPYILNGFKTIQKRWPLNDVENEWLTNCHQIRTHAYNPKEGIPVPEGIHRDGVEYIMMGCVSRVEIKGGVSHVHDTAVSPPIFETTLEPGEAIIIDDRELFHMATPILANEDYGYRDMILMGFHFWSRGHYRANWRDNIYKD